MKFFAGLFLLLFLATSVNAGQNLESNSAVAVTNGRTFVCVSADMVDQRIRFGLIGSSSAATNSTTGETSDRFDLSGSAELHLHFDGHEFATDFRPKLDSSMARLDYRVDEVSYRREVVVNGTNQTITVRIRADHQRRLHFTARLENPETNAQSHIIGTNILSLANQTAEIKTDGTVLVEPNSLKVKGANTATVTITAR
ncbi:MAG TPA: glycoside hydrolase N-terminal domain-containing protein [Candidatus Paceibacterota bacterium]|nr:glycoside hydrolase N-terminal domain-containing protein [Candidatus Paceibacterota bacterium]